MLLSQAGTALLGADLRPMPPLVALGLVLLSVAASAANGDGRAVAATLCSEAPAGLGAGVAWLLLSSDHASLLIGGVHASLMSVREHAAVRLKTDDSGHRAKRWVQDTFAIASGGCQPYDRWVAPEPGQPGNVSTVVARRVAEFARANFSVMDGSFGSAFKPFNSSSRPFETWQGRVLQQIELAEEFGLKVIPELGEYQYQRDNQASFQWLQTWASTHAAAASRIFRSPSFWGFEIRDEPPATEFATLRNLSAQVGTYSS